MAHWKGVTAGPRTLDVMLGINGLERIITGRYYIPIDIEDIHRLARFLIAFRESDFAFGCVTCVIPSNTYRVAYMNFLRWGVVMGRKGWGNTWSSKDYLASKTNNAQNRNDDNK